MKLIPLLMLFFAWDALACWKVQAFIQAGDEEIEINHKINHGETYSFSLGQYLMHLKIVKGIRDHQEFEWIIQERQGSNLQSLTKDRSSIRIGERTTFRSSQMIAGQPATIKMIIKEI